MRVRVGTSGYDFEDWVGAFYPEDLPAEDRLRAYAARFDTVEINNTFYRNPKSDVVAHWAAQVGDDFRFTIKASRRISHRAPLTDLDTLGFLWRSLQHLGERLGPLLFQLTPYARRDVARLEAFLAALPDGLRAVFEFRNRSWHDDAVFAALRAANAAWCVSDQPKLPADAVVATADWGYLRLHRAGYTDAELADWAAQVRAQEWREAYVFFKHDLDAAGPAAAQRFLEA